MRFGKQQKMCRVRYFLAYQGTVKKPGQIDVPRLGREGKSRFKTCPKLHRCVFKDTLFHVSFFLRISFTICGLALP